MNGVIRASVSPGSSQRETSVTWTPMVSVPGWAATASENGATTRPTRTSSDSRDRASIRESSESTTRLAPQPAGGDARALDEGLELGPHHAGVDLRRARERGETAV